MSALKEINAHAVSTWSPVASRSNVLALGSKEGVGVGFDNVGGELQLHSMNFSDVSPTTTSLGAVKTSSRFLSIAWAESSKFTQCPYGAIAGGMADGCVNIWNPAKIIQGKDAESQIGRIQRHKGPVNVVAFNPHKDSSHLLASGGSDNEVFIMSLEKLSAPGVFSPAGPNAKHTAEVTCVSWNSQVSYIMATGSANGSTIVWDLKQKKPWCELKDLCRGIVSAVAWNPTEGLNLITASGDDQRPSLKLWDLRTSTSTCATEFHGHTAGILSVSWCPNDPGLILSCGKDNKTFMWDLYAGKPIFEFPSNTAAAPSGSGQFFSGAAGGQRRFHVEWAKQISAVASTSTFDGKVQVWGLAGAGGKETTRAPSWCRRPANGSFGFGGKFVTISNPKGPQPGPKLVHMHRLVTEPEVVTAAERFESAMQLGNYKAFCEDKIRESKVKHERDVWEFMQILFESDARQQLLLHLGFDTAVISAQVAKYTGKAIPTEPTAAEPVAAEPPQSADDVFSAGAALEPSPIADIAVPSPDTSKKIDGGPIPVYTEEGENMIRRSLLVGDFEGAVDCCLRNNQLADALLLATCGGPELWARTQEAYFSRQNRPFMRIVSAIIKSELSTLVTDSPLDQWQETLAILSTYGKSEEFPALCDMLGNRLEEAGDVKAATLCFMCAVNVERTVKLWVKSAGLESRDIGTSAALQKLIEKVSIFAQILDPPNQDMGIEVGRQFSAYAAMLASQGRLDVASRFAIHQDTESAIMRYRLYMAAPQPGVAPPPFPFDDAAPVAAVPAQQQQQQQPYQQPQAYGTQPQQGYGAQPQAYGAPAAPVASGYGAPQPQQYQSPSGQFQQPGYQQPTTPYQQPQPGTGFQQPAPAPAVPQPGVGFHQPQQPGTGFQQPAPSPSYGGGGGYMPGPQQSTGVNSLAAASKAKSRVAKTPIDMNKQRSDGFVSSVGNKELSMKYGNTVSTPMSPMAEPVAAPAAPLGSTNNVGPADMPIVNGFNEVIKNLEGAQLLQSERRQLAEMQKAKNIMFSKLNGKELSPNVVARLHEIVKFFQARDFRSAQQVHVALTTTDWAEHKDWLRGVKALINIAIKRLG